MVEAPANAPNRPSEARGWKRNTTSCLVAALLLGAVLLGLLIEVPESLPAVALDQPLLYRLEIGLVAFYGGLLLLTPLFRGVIDGQLPIEISARGAKFAENVAGSLKDTQATVEDFGKQLSSTRGDLLLTQLALRDLHSEVQRLKPPEIPGLERKKPGEAN